MEELSYYFTEVSTSRLDVGSNIPLSEYSGDRNIAFAMVGNKAFVRSSPEINVLMKSCKAIYRNEGLVQGNNVRMLAWHTEA